MKLKLKHIPNILSVIRLLLVLAFVIAFFCFDKYLALIIFLLAGFTDVLDGYLARRNHWITDLGKILDPLADKAMQCTVLVCLCIGGYLPVWFAIPFFLKEGLTLLIGAIVIKRRDVAVVSKWYGKMTVCLFYATVVVSLIFSDFMARHILVQVLICFPVILCAIISFIAYVRHYAYLKREEVRHGNLLKKRKDTNVEESHSER